MDKESEKFYEGCLPLTEYIIKNGQDMAQRMGMSPGQFVMAMIQSTAVVLGLYTDAEPPKGSLEEVLLVLSKQVRERNAKLEAQQ